MNVDMPTSETSKNPSADLEAAQEGSALLRRAGYLFRRLVQVNQALFAEEVGALNADVTPVQFTLMTALSEKGELDQNTLSAEVGLERTSVAEVLPRLEDRGLIERRQSLDDRRVKLVRLSRKGKTMVKQLADAVQRSHDRTIEALPESERDLFMLQLIRLIEANDSRIKGPLNLG
jgi:DNA-binding MarR family transcriptional regulator